MIYEGKEYKEVTDDSCSVGDLMHINELGEKKHVGWCFTMDATINPYVDRILADESNVLDPLCDKFTRYREVVEQIIPLTNPKKAHDIIKQTDIFNTPSLSENINDLFTEIKNIIVSKNENYGNSFSKQYQKYGMVSVEMRLNDKFMRLEQLVAGEKDKVGESIEDTLKDIIGYATLALIELEGEEW